LAEISCQLICLYILLLNNFCKKPIFAANKVAFTKKNAGKSGQFVQLLKPGGYFNVVKQVKLLLFLNIKSQKTGTIFTAKN
jgi:hypothetical protein